MLFCSLFLLLMVAYNYAAINLTTPGREPFFQGLYHAVGAALVALVVGGFWGLTRGVTLFSFQFAFFFCGIYWILFDGLLNLARRKPWYYVGQNARLDRLLTYLSQRSRLPLPILVPLVKFSLLALILVLGPAIHHFFPTF